MTELDIAVLGPAGGEAGIGETLLLNPVDDVRVRVRFRDPAGVNHGGQNPSVRRVDLITGEVNRSGADLNNDRNLSTRVVRRFTAADWHREGEFGVIETTLSRSAQDRYLRVRGTSSEHAEPLMDEPGEDPWDDLWFYSNPIFLDVNEGRPSLNN